MNSSANATASFHTRLTLTDKIVTPTHNPSIALELISPFAADFAKRLFTAHPELRAEMQPVPHDTDDRFGLRFTIPAVLSGAGPLRVEVVDSEVTISFDLWENFHRVDEFEAATEDQAKDDAVTEITGLLSERLALALLVREDDRCVGAGLFAVDGENPFTDYPDRRVCVRSWRGTFDSGWTLPWPEMDD